jgi:hypothetical protein
MSCHHPTSWTTSQGKCLCGEQVGHRHVHTPRGDGQGNQVCSVCNMVIITPILSSDDPRLQPEPERYGPLPEILVTLYYDGPDYGLPRAPIAPYVRDIAAYEGELNRIDPKELWDRLLDMVA